MATVKFVAIALLVSILAVFCKSDNQPGLKSLGSVNGKSYFLERNTNVNWTEAWTFCRDSGMALATLETMEENNFLANALGKLYLLQESFSFWLDGQGQAFYWNAFYNNETKYIEMDVRHKLDWGLLPRSEYKDYCGNIEKYSGQKDILVGAYYCGLANDGAVCQQPNDQFIPFF